MDEAAKQRAQLTFVSWVVGPIVTALFLLQWPWHVIVEHWCFPTRCKLRRSFSLHLAFFAAPPFYVMQKMFVQGAVGAGVPVRQAQAASKALCIPHLPVGPKACRYIGHAWDWESFDSDHYTCPRCIQQVELRAL